MHERVGYSLFFSTLAALCAYYWFVGTTPERWLLLWPTVSCIVMTLAYALHRPFLVSGKTTDGTVSVLLTLVNLPWLAFTWLSWLFVVLFSREPGVSPIAGTNLSISRYPLFGVDLVDFDRIFDLTAECPRLYRSSAHYQCLPNLDGVALSNLQHLSTSGPHEKVLIHCAQGHGRSATFAALLLTDSALFVTTQAAHEAILASRPGAKLAKSQRLQLMSHRADSEDSRQTR